MTPIEKQQNFHKELKELLFKYKAELSIEDFGHGYLPDEKIVVIFQFDESLFVENETGIIPQLILGRYENGAQSFFTAAHNTDIYVINVIQK